MGIDVTWRRRTHNVERHSEGYYSGNRLLVKRPPGVRLQWEGRDVPSVASEAISVCTHGYARYNVPADERRSAWAQRHTEVPACQPKARG
jgi:hypothetical protein